MAKKEIPISETKFKTEFHHTCNNPAICKTKTNPDENCEGCFYYKLREVKVAIEPIREKIDWGF